MLLETQNSAVGGPNPGLATCCGMRTSYEDWRTGVEESTYGGYFGKARHQDMMNLGFYDGHAKAMRPYGIPEEYFDIQDCMHAPGQCWSWR